MSNIEWLPPLAQPENNLTHPESTPTHPESTPTHPESTPTHPESTLNAPRKHPQRTCAEPPVADADNSRVLFSLQDVLDIACVTRQVLERSWLPALERVAPGRVKRGKGKYTRRCMELIVSLRQARSDGLSIDAWVETQRPEDPETLNIEAAVAEASAVGAIVPVEVVEVSSAQAQSLVLAQSQSMLASSLLQAVATGLQGQVASQNAQKQAINDEHIRTQAALEYARELQIKAQVRASMDAALLAQAQANLAQQVQQFQGGGQS